MIDQMPLRSFLKAVALATLLLSTPAWAASPSATPKPNIMIMFIDDMGYGDIGPFGNKVNQTPHLDRMAEEGRVLTQFYVANTPCTPSRAALPDPKNRKISVSGKGSGIVSMVINELKSSWPQK